jgi:hypothetical protein
MTLGYRKGREGGLTRCRFDPLVGSRLELPYAFAQRFVSGHDDHHAKEGQDQRGSGGDLPLAEDNANVVVVPGEEHL